MKRTGFIIVMVGLMSLIAGLFSQQWLNAKQQTMTAPEFHFPDTHGVDHSSDEWKGKVLIINFWATWCPPCREEIPEFIKLQAELKEKGVQFIGIAVEDADPVKDYMAFVDFNYPVLVGGDDASMLAMKMGNVLNTLPFSVVIDQSNKVVHAQMGVFSRDQIMEVVRPLIGRGS